MRKSGVERERMKNLRSSRTLLRGLIDDFEKIFKEVGPKGVRSVQAHEWNQNYEGEEYVGYGESTVADSGLSSGEKLFIVTRDDESCVVGGTHGLSSASKLIHTLGYCAFKN